MSLLFAFYFLLVFFILWFTTIPLQNCRTLLKAYEMNPVLHFLGYGISIPLLLAHAISKTRSAEWNLFQRFTCAKSPCFEYNQRMHFVVAWSVLELVEASRIQQILKTHQLAREGWLFGYSSHHSRWYLCCLYSLSLCCMHYGLVVLHGLKMVYYGLSLLFEEPKNTDAVCNKLSCWLSHFVKFDLTLKILM